MSTITDTDISEIVDIELGDEVLHVSCCVVDRFLCDHPYHPEVSATNEDDEDDCCQTCVDLIYKTMCPPHRPTHEHCPFNNMPVCPTEARRA